MNLEIIADSTFTFAITVDGREYLLRQSGGDWLMSGDNPAPWIASKRVDWPEALARALRVAAGLGGNTRARMARERHREG